MQLLIHPEIKVDPCQEKGSLKSFSLCIYIRNNGMDCVAMDLCYIRRYSILAIRTVCGAVE